MTEKPHVSSISPALTTQPIEAGIYDINLVTREELLLIDGVNTEIADGILAMRELLGGYQNVRELVFVEQICGNELMQTLFAHLYVADAAETTASTVG